MVSDQPVTLGPDAHAWRADPTNLLIVSPTGGGKTYLACAIGISACLTEHTVTCTRMDDPATSARHPTRKHLRTTKNARHRRA